MTATAPALTLRITHRDGQPLPEPLPSRTFDLRGGSIGRAPQNDWVLSDPERYLSAHHATLYFDEGAFRLVDCSTNGVFLNGQPQPLGSERIATLSHGDRLRLGDYDIEVAITGPAGDGATRAAPLAATASGQALDPLQLLQAGSSPSPFPSRAPAAPARSPYAAADPWLELTPRRHEALPGGSSQVLDPLALLGTATALGRALPPPAAATAYGDGVPALGACFKPPAAVLPVPADWLRSLVVPHPGFGTPATGAARPGACDDDALVEPEASVAAQPVEAGQRPPGACPAPGLGRTAPASLGQAGWNGTAALAAAPPTPPTPAAAGAAADGPSAALALVLQSAGLDPGRLPTLDAGATRRALQATGLVLREALSALRELALQRAALRREQGQAPTLIAPRDNNPLKFAPRGVAEVLDGFLFDRGGACLGPEAAIAQLLAELKAQHALEQRALRQRLREQLDRLDPLALARECPPGRLRLRPAAAAHWERFTERHAQLRQALDAQQDGGAARAADRLTLRPLSRQEVPHGLA